MKVIFLWALPVAITSFLNEKIIQQRVGLSVAICHGDKNPTPIHDPLRHDRISTSIPNAGKLITNYELRINN